MREYILIMSVAAIVTYLTCGLMRKIALKTGVMARVRSRDVHSNPTPYMGGMSMLIGVAVAFLLAAQMPFLGRHEVVTKDSAGILLAATVICIIGLVDDIIELPAIAKAAGQILAAGLAVVGGIRMYWISLPNQIIALDPATSILITVIFIFICVNAINFVDGLDGLAAGVVGIGASALFAYTYVLAREQNLVVATTASLVSATITGVCIGFLPHNFHRAKIFMGDAGAMLLGFLLACSSLSFTGQIDSASVDPSGGTLLPSWLPLVLPFAIMALPILDMTAAYIRRTIKGQWWFEADKQHLHHRLVRTSRSQHKAVMIMYVWTALIGYGVVAIGLIQQLWAIGLIVGIWAVAFAINTLWLRYIQKTVLNPANLD